MECCLTHSQCAIKIGLCTVIVFDFNIDDIADSVQSQLSLSTDDALSYSILKDRHSKLQAKKDLDSLAKRLLKWGISFTTKKRNIIMLGKNKMVYWKQITYYLCRDLLDQIESCRYLGILTNQNIKWEPHINSIISKAFRILGLMKRILFNVPRKVKYVAYTSLCSRPILEYAVEV